MTDFSYEHWDPDDPLYDPEDDDAGHHTPVPLLLDLWDDPDE